MIPGIAQNETVTSNGTETSASQDQCGVVSDGRIFGVLAVVLLFFLVMGMAGSVDINTLRSQFHRKMGILCGIFCQFFLMPCISFAIVSVAQPPLHTALSIQLVASSPGGAYSNWWCSLFNADLALSVAMTAVSTILSIGMLPLNLTIYTTLLYGVEFSIPWGALIQSVSTVFMAVVVGIAITTKMPSWKPKMILLGNLSGVTLIILTLFSSIFTTNDNPDDEKTTPPWQKSPQIYVLIVALFFLALLSSMLISSLWFLRLKRPERVAIIVEICYQNIGIASAVALSAYCDDPKKRSDAATVPLLYGTLQAITLAIFCIGAWKFGWTYGPPNKSFCDILLKDFQPRANANPAPQVTEVTEESEPPPAESTSDDVEGSPANGGRAVVYI